MGAGCGYLEQARRHLGLDSHSYVTLLTSRHLLARIRTKDKYCHSRHAGHLAHVVDDPDIVSRGYFSHRPWFYPLAHFLPKMLIIEVNVVAQSSP